MCLGVFAVDVTRPKLEFGVSKSGDLRSIRSRKARRIGEVEEFTAYLYQHTLSNLEFLAEGKIGIVNPIRTQCGDLARALHRNACHPQGNAKQFALKTDCPEAAAW